MKNKYKYLMALAILGIATGAKAQNLNPTVQVTRVYEGRLMEVHKPSQTMYVPDSLLHFNLNFDYSVFENPYNGAYDFTPYLMNIKPNAETSDANRLYLRLGAGYALKPTFDLAWEPTMKGRYRMGVYATHNSYVGNYRNIGTEADGSGFKLTKDGSSNHSGYDLYSRAGVWGRSDWVKSVFDFDVAYEGIHTKDTLGRTSYNSVVSRFHTRSLARGRERYFYYNAFLEYGFAKESRTDASSMGVHNLDFMASVGPVFGKGGSVLLDVAGGMTAHTSALDAVVMDFSLTPKYVFDRNRWWVSAGVEFAFGSVRNPLYDGHDINKNKGQIVYPDVHASFDAVKDYLTLYADVDGGLDRNPYRQSKLDNHFFNASYGRGVGPFSENSVTQVNADLGFRGNIASKFVYDLKIGFESLDDAMVDAVVKSAGGGALMPAVSFAGYNNVYASVDLAWHPKSFDFWANAKVNSSNFTDKDVPGFEESLLDLNFRARYNWNKRIYCGVSAEYATARKGYAYEAADHLVDAKIPGWFDLGLNFEYVVNRKFSVWAEGGNLLNQTIQRHPLYPESGIWGRVGICLSL